LQEFALKRFRSVFFLIFLSALVAAPPLSAQEGAASVSIKYYNKTVYYPDDSPDNPIFIHVSITNTGTETLRFKLADDRTFSMDFTARTQKSAMLTKTDTVLRKRTTNNTVYFREIALEAGEAYSFVENVKDYLVIPESSLYYLEVQFYPELYKSRTLSIRSNMLTLEIRPSPQSAASSAVPVYSDTMRILVPEDIPPDRVVEQTIIARQRGMWDQYFLYIDIEQMLMRDPVRERKYRTGSSTERNNMLVNYRADLMQSRIERDIVAIPEKFSIERTLYSRTEGTVTVIEWFKYDDFREKKRYTYYVRQRDGIWHIYDYAVENMGTE
jgi:hypothetical protein